MTFLSKIILLNKKQVYLLYFSYLYIFIGILQKVDAAEFMDFNNARNGEAIRRPRGLKDRRRQSRILQATAKLNRMEYTISEFLEIVSKEFLPVQNFNGNELIEVK